MPELSLQEIVFLTGLGVFTVATFITDLRYRKIPNKITVPAFAAGLLYQGIFNGGMGLLDALAGFAVGFGLFFLIWFLGVGGGGDTKLMGAASVWLGFQPTLYLLATSTVVVVAIAIGVMVWSVLAHGSGNAKKKYLSKAITDARGGKRGKKEKRTETVEEKQDRRITAYAIPVAIGTWFVVMLKYDSFFETAAAAEALDETPAATAPETPGDDEPASDTDPTPGEKTKPDTNTANDDESKPEEDAP